MIKQTRSKSSAADQGTEAESPEAPRYFIELEASGRERSVSAVIGERQCHTHRQHELEDAKPADLIKQITKHCKDTSDFLLPDSPIKEAIFRVLLANGNEPLSAEEVSQILSDRWAMSASPRDLSPWAIQRLMEHSPGYFMARVPEPEPPPEEEVAVEEGTTEEDLEAERDNATDDKDEGAEKADA